MDRRTDHRISEITNGVYLINEFDGTNCYLVVGSERALLIDTGVGYGDLLGAVRKITDLPLEVVLTHGHIDHAGGHGQFESMYMHPDDDIRFLKFLITKRIRRLSVRFSLAKKLGITKKDVIKRQYKFSFKNLYEGQVFELGGKTIRVRVMPGHSKGSVVFLAEEDKLMFTGDNVCPLLWMFVPNCTSIEEWLLTGQEIYRLSEQYRPLSAHDNEPQTREQIGELLRYAEELIALKTKNSRFLRIKSYPQSGAIRILYRTDLVKTPKNQKRIKV
ncbi:MAG: MBL fold metallo-hydrolase [Clostridia bacterium]